MRSSLSVLLAALPLTALLSGCAMSPTGGASNAASQAVPAAATLKGKAFGGQQPVVGATIAVYTFGTSGYGSSGTLLGTATTASDGSFTLNFTCPSSTAPVYALSIGGTNGYGSTPNTAIAEGAGLGTCSSADGDQFVVINEITTAVLATSFSHFFSSTTSDGTTTDHFGSPADLNTAVARVNDVLIPAVLSVGNGYPNNSTSTFTNESAKILTLGNILASCVNSSGPGSEYCVNLFAYTTPTGGTPPTNVLEAAVNIARYPQANVDQLYGLSGGAGSSAFGGNLTAYPTDWTIAVSFINPNLGLGLNTRSVSTLDIDTSGRVWFPNDVSSAPGVAYFDPSSLSFSSVYTAPGMVYPQQVAIDINGTAWVTDSGSDVLTGFPTSSPSSPYVLTLPGYHTTAVSVLDNNNLRVGLVNTSTSYPSLGQVIDNNGGSSYTYSQIAGTNVDTAGIIIPSLAGDTVGGSALTTTQTTGTQAYGYGFYFSAGDTLSLADYAAGEDLGQVVFTGSNFINTRGGYSNISDGLCIYSMQNCYQMLEQTATRHPGALVIDGAAGLWMADNDTTDVQFVPLNAGSYVTNDAIYDQVYAHGTNNGGTLTGPAGIGVDNTGNVWVSNYGCTGNSCKPGSFVLTEIIGAGTPTINPVSAQVVLGTRGGAGTEPK